MKRIFGRSGKEKEDEAEELSLDILLAHKEDIITKVSELYIYHYILYISAEEWVQDISDQEDGDREGPGLGGEAGVGAEVSGEGQGTSQCVMFFMPGNWICLVRRRS